MAAHVVLDSSSVLAVIKGELGWDKVAAVLSVAAITSVNAAEIYTKLVEWNMTVAEQGKFKSLLRELVVDFDDDLALRTGALRPATKSLGLSLGDRACLALAQKLDVPAMTADKVWAKLDIGIKIQVIR